MIYNTLSQDELNSLQNIAESNCSASWIAEEILAEYDSNAETQKMAV